ncbi:hypothetical protein CYMTET_9110 [Cymbomonas tetramitiformis]|uniref:Uncharacterized protein n=1 Tax=Cymbomonas tetramitiformis TaxID=36881 RepID=A0AAE0GSC9_9CHLO|nr:hypothetical protein CYMTET_9110 [Cymbomonas tetramitiformis]
MIIKQDTLLLDINPILDFSIFPENRHTADALARWIRALGVPYTLTLAAYSLVTGDGASPNKKAAKILKAPYKMTGCFNKSAQLQKALQQDATQAEGENLCKAKVVLQAHAIRWGGFYKQLRRNRFLEGRMKLALTGDAYGLCGEEAADIVAYTTSLSTVAEEADSDSGDEEDQAQEEVSDTEQCALGQEEANYAEGKAFPMQHRCLLPTEWRTNNFFESVLTTPHDISQALQKPSGAGLDFGYLLLLSLNTQLQQKVVDVVVGGEQDEHWEPVAATALPAEVQRFRDILSREITTRCLTIDEHVALALKLNVEVDTSHTGLLCGKRAVLELMDAQYHRALRQRFLHIQAKKKKEVAAGAAGSATLAVADTTTAEAGAGAAAAGVGAAGAGTGASGAGTGGGGVSTVEEALARPAKRKKPSIGNMMASFRPAGVELGAVEKEIEEEKVTFEALNSVGNATYKDQFGDFDQIAFYNNIQVST